MVGKVSGSTKLSPKLCHRCLPNSAPPQYAGQQILTRSARKTIACQSSFLAFADRPRIRTALFIENVPPAQDRISLKLYLRTRGERAVTQCTLSIVMMLSVGQHDEARFKELPTIPPLRTWCALYDQKLSTPFARPLCSTITICGVSLTAIHYELVPSATRTTSNTVGHNIKCLKHCDVHAPVSSALRDQKIPDQEGHCGKSSYHLGSRGSSDCTLAVLMESQRLRLYAASHLVVCRNHDPASRTC